jgi:hypothetical protein
VVDDSKDRLQRTSSIINGDGAAIAAATAKEAMRPTVVVQPWHEERVLPAGNGSGSSSSSSGIPAGAAIGSGNGPAGAAAVAEPGPLHRVLFKGVLPAEQKAAKLSIPPNGKVSGATSPLGQLFDRNSTASILYPDVAAFAAAGMYASGADCYTKQPGDQQALCSRARSEFGESMLTDATWLTEAGPSTAASALTATLTGISSRGGWDSSMESCAWGSEGFETVFHMTGEAVDAAAAAWMRHDRYSRHEAARTMACMQFHMCGIEALLFVYPAGHLDCTFWQAEL